MTPIDKLNILITILSRAPMTQAEQIGVQSIIDDLVKVLTPPAKDQAPATAPEGEPNRES